jgi:YesN/AraC family two-component response regulator
MYILYEYPYKLNPYNGEIVSEQYLYWSNYFRANNFPDWVLVIRTILNIVYSLLSYRILFKYFKTKSASIQINKVKKWLFTFANVKFILTIVNLIIVTFVLGLGKTNDFSIDVIILSIVLIMLTLILIVYKNKNILYNIPEYVNSNNYYNLKVKQEVNLNEVFKNITHEIFIQELFLNKDFKLSWLSDNLNIKQKHITLAISENGFENFSAYSNHFKIEKAKQLIKAGYLYDYSIEALADAAGFKAVTSFYRIFKSATGLTPSKYDCLFNKENK